MRGMQAGVVLAGLLAMPAWACPPEGFDKGSLVALKADGFQVSDGARQVLALGLAGCLADPDPAVRDGIAYEALSKWLRGDALEAETRQALLVALLPWISPGAGDGFVDGGAAEVAEAAEAAGAGEAEGEDGAEASADEGAEASAEAIGAAGKDAVVRGERAAGGDYAVDRSGFRPPFAALVLSEVARTDRIAAWMSPEQREELVAAATAYLASVDDYRGFDAQGGWRHGVAHGADLLMQLALNPALDGAQRLRILEAVGTQVAPAGEHFYVYGEPERLSRPVLFVLASKSVDEAAWKAWLAKITAPAPLANWRDAYGSQAGLAKRHNTRAFLLALYAGTLGSEDPAMRAAAAAVAEVLRTTG